MNNKLIIVGIDGGTFEVINELIKNGHLPTFKYIIENGVSANLISTIPPVTGAAWPSMLTGVNPGKHGVFDFIEYCPEKYDGWFNKSFVDSSCLAGKTFLDLLSNKGELVGGIAIPVTYPPWEINGILVSGYPCPDTNTNYVFIRNVNITEDEIPPLNFSAEYYQIASEKKIAEDGYKMTRTRTELALKLWTENDFRCLFFVLGETDRAQHNFWKYYRKNLRDKEDVVTNTYIEVDKSIQKILNKIDNETTLFLVSDHGGGERPRTYFYINEFLKKEGYIVLNKTTIWEHFYSFLKKTKAKSKLFRKLYFNISARLDKKSSDWIMHTSAKTFVSKINFSRTKAYMYPMQFPAFGIVINKKNRQPEGIVDDQEYEKLREEIILKLNQLKDDKGRKIVSMVFKREEIYKGPFLKKAPDIVALTTEYFEANKDFPNRMFGSVPDVEYDRLNGYHRMEGIFIAYGKHIKKGIKINKMSIMDIAPNVLYLLGHEIPTYIDGSVKPEIFENNFVNSQKPKYVEREFIPSTKKHVFSEQDKDEIRKKLEPLGYL